MAYCGFWLGILTRKQLHSIGERWLLKNEGMAPDLMWAPWDHCPDTDGEYDGIIVGWAAYMLIRGREGRIEFLRELRARVVDGSPVLLSFMTRSERSPYFRYIARTGNILASPLGRDRVDVGDTLLPNFAHRFTREQLEAEMTEGGFRIVSYSEVPYGHAVGRAV
jgi:hypothetical protein